MVTKNKYLIYTLGLLLFFIASCQKSLLKPSPGDSPLSTFDYLWADVNERYSYFQVKNIDWQSIRLQYRSIIDDNMSDEALFNVLSDMLFELRDGHVNITTTFDRSRNWDWFQDHPINYNQNIIDRSYLQKDFQITGPFRIKRIDSILYVNYRSFGDAVDDSHILSLLRQAEGSIGMIIDVRSNGGGSLSNAYKIAGALTNSSRIYARERIKIGPEEDEFSPWINLSTNKRFDNAYGNPVVVLCNRASYSATTFFAQMIKSLPNGTMMGDQTGGGGGIPAFGELPNGWMYRFSATQAIDPQGNHLEFGVEPDIVVSMLKEDEDNDKDTILESAIQFIQQQ